MSSESLWVCLIDGRELGPITLEKVKGLFAAGTLGPADKLRPHPDGEWKHVCEFDSLLRVEMRTVAAGDDSHAPPRESHFSTIALAGALLAIVVAVAVTLIFGRSAPRAVTTSPKLDASKRDDSPRPIRTTNKQSNATWLPDIKIGDWRNDVNEFYKIVDAIEHRRDQGRAAWELRQISANSNRRGHIYFAPALQLFPLMSSNTHPPLIEIPSKDEFQGGMRIMEWAEPVSWQTSYDGIDVPKEKLQLGIAKRWDISQTENKLAADYRLTFHPPQNQEAWTSLKLGQKVIVNGQLALVCSMHRGADKQPVWAVHFQVRDATPTIPEMEVRVWTIKETPVRAELIEVSGGSVTLQDEKGRRKSFNLRDLSSEDRDYVRELK